MAVHQSGEKLEIQGKSHIGCILRSKVCTWGTSTIWQARTTTNLGMMGRWAPAARGAEFQGEKAGKRFMGRSTHGAQGESSTQKEL